MIATADSHPVENIVEFNSQLGIHSLAKEEFLPNRQCFAAFKRIAEARIEWSSITDSPGPPEIDISLILTQALPRNP